MLKSRLRAALAFVLIALAHVAYAQTPAPGAANAVWRDWSVNGVASSGVWNPRKSDIRLWGGQVEGAIAGLQAGQAGGAYAFDTRANLYAFLTPAANSIASVYSDSTPAYNGIYQKTGASGAGSWTRLSDLVLGPTPTISLGSFTLLACNAVPTFAITGTTYGPTIDIGLPACNYTGASPVPATGTGVLGGVQAKAATSHQFLTEIVAGTGVINSAQPAYSDIAGTPAIPSVSSNVFYADLGAPQPNISRLGDRVTVGFTNNSVLSSNPTTAQQSWAAANSSSGNMGWGERDAALSAFTTHGGVSIAAASRASDYSNGAAAKNAHAFWGYGLADVANSTGEAAYFEARTVNASGTAIGIEVDAGNFAGSSPTINPYQLINVGASIGLAFGAGGDPSTPGTVYSSTAAIAVGANKSNWLRGLVLGATAISGTDGVTGTGIAIELAKGHEQRWIVDTFGTRGGFIRSDATTASGGLVFLNSGLRVVSNPEVSLLEFPTTGGIKFFGSTSGSGSLNFPAVAGSSAITFPAGTTNFSATGGAGQIVQQSSSGGALTVSTLAYSALTGYGTGVSTALGIAANTAGGPLVPSAALGSASIVLGGGSGGAPNASGCTINGNNSISCISSAAFNPQMIIQNTAVATSASYLNFGKSRAGAIVQTGDSLGTLMFQGHDGTTFVNAAYISALVYGTPSTGNVLANLNFIVGGSTIMTVGPWVNILSTTASTSTTTGALIVSGGIGATGAVYSANHVLTAAAPTVAAAQVGIGSTTAANTSCGTLAGSAGCLVINVAGTQRYVPYY